MPGWGLARWPLTNQRDRRPRTLFFSPSSSARCDTPRLPYRRQPSSWSAALSSRTAFLPSFSLSPSLSPFSVPYSFFTPSQTAKMYRTTLRTASRQALGSLRAQTPRSALRFRRPASTASPADRPRSWKSSALRWGLAIAAVYYYNTSPVFAEEAADQGTVQRLGQISPRRVSSCPPSRLPLFTHSHKNKN